MIEWIRAVTGVSNPRHDHLVPDTWGEPVGASSINQREAYRPTTTPGRVESTEITAQKLTKDLNPESSDQSALWI